MSVETQGIDRAMWRRFTASNRDRCDVCGHTAVVSISLSATELGGKNGAAIANRKMVFCDTHGQMRFNDALRKLLGAEVLKS